MGKGRTESAKDAMSGDQLELDQIGFLRFPDRCAMANRCCYRTTVGDFGLKGLVELQLVPGHPTSDGAYPVHIWPGGVKGRATGCG